MALSPTGSRGGTGTVTGVTAADTSIVVAGTAAAPTLATGTLDVLATNHPPAADVALNAKKITGLGTPTLSTDAVTKAYTDAAINGLDWKQAARLASAVALPANTYVNGASGVGATLTGNAFGALTIDGVAVAVNDRVLLKTEGASSHNGIYSVTATGDGAAFYVLTRTADYNTTAEIVAGTGLYVTEGTANADTSWVMTTTGAVTVGTTALTFTQFGGGGSLPALPWNAGPGLFQVDAHGNVTISPDLSTGHSQLLIKGRTAGADFGAQGVLNVEDTHARKRMYLQVFELEDIGESDTYLGISCGDGGGAADFGSIDIDLTRKGSTTGAYPGYFIEMQGASDTSGFLGIGAYRSDRNHKALKVDWATGLASFQVNPDAANASLIALTTDSKIGFFNAAPVVKPTGVAVSAAGIHAALVSLGLIAA